MARKPPPRKAAKAAAKPGKGPPPPKRKAAARGRAAKPKIPSLGQGLMGLGGTGAQGMMP